MLLGSEMESPSVVVLCKIQGVLYSVGATVHPQSTEKVLMWIHALRRREIGASTRLPSGYIATRYHSLLLDENTRR